MNATQIDRLINRRKKLTNRRDGRINRPAVNEIDSALEKIAPGARNDVDLLLGRSCATLPPRADYGDRAAAIVAALERAAAETCVTAEWLTPQQVAWLETVNDARRDWEHIKGDLAL